MKTVTCLLLMVCCSIGAMAQTKADFHVMLVDKTDTHCSSTAGCVVPADYRVTGYMMKGDNRVNYVLSCHGEVTAGTPEGTPHVCHKLSDAIGQAISARIINDQINFWPESVAQNCPTIMVTDNKTRIVECYNIESAKVDSAPAAAQLTSSQPQSNLSVLLLGAETDTTTTTFYRNRDCTGLRGVHHGDHQPFNWALAVVGHNGRYEVALQDEVRKQTAYFGTNYASGTREACKVVRGISKTKWEPSQ